MFDFKDANEAQREAISTTSGPVLITAGPGTGKTFTLVQRAIYIIQECERAIYKLSKDVTIDNSEYGILINMLLENHDEIKDERVVVSSIESIKGQEGKNCLFILTTDLAAYLFGDKTEDNTTKNQLYVALTRSLDKLTIFITNKVEKKFGRGENRRFF